MPWGVLAIAVVCLVIGMVVGAGGLLMWQDAQRTRRELAQPKPAPEVVQSPTVAMEPPGLEPMPNYRPLPPLPTQAARNGRRHAVPDPLDPAVAVEPRQPARLAGERTGEHPAVRP